jgi:hypothetical protein
MDAEDRYPPLVCALIWVALLVSSWACVGAAAWVVLHWRHLL